MGIKFVRTYVKYWGTRYYDVVYNSGRQYSYIESIDRIPYTVRKFIETHEPTPQEDRLYGEETIYK